MFPRFTSVSTLICLTVTQAVTVPSPYIFKHLLGLAHTRAAGRAVAAGRLVTQHSKHSESSSIKFVSPPKEE